MTDVALALDGLVPGADYGGALTDNSEASFDALRWADERPKPTWAAVVAWRAADFDPPLPVVDPPCVARLDVADGDVQNVSADSGISFAFAVDTNVFQVYFAASKPNGYTWAVSATSGDAKVTDPQADYVEITVIDPTEPYSLSIQIFTVS